MLSVYVLLPLAKFLFRNWRRLVFGLVAFATIIALFYAVENWRGKRAWEQFKRDWEARGEKLEFKDFVPPQIPDEQNFAMVDIVASSYEYILTRNGDKVPYEQRNTNAVNHLDFGLANDCFDKAAKNPRWVMGAATDIKEKLAVFATKTNLFDPPKATLSDAQNLLRALNKYAGTVEELRLAGQRPQSRFPLNYNTDCPAAILLPHVAAMKRAAQLLHLRSLAELRDGQSNQALADTQLTMRLIEAIRTEPFLITHLVRAAMLNLALQSIYEGLANHQWSEDQLKKLDLDLAKLDFVADCKFSIRGEVGMQSGVFDFLEKQPKELANLGAEGNQNGSDGASSFVPVGWFYQNQLRCARFVMLNNLPVVDTDQKTISPTLSRQANRAFDVELKKTTPYNFIERILLPRLNEIKLAHAQASVNLARTAIALELYRLANGNYPEALDALAPQFITKIPHDVIGGGPLKYRCETDGTFTLYSIGWNEKDDGGEVVFKKGSTSELDLTQGDWVWRYPAKN